MVGAVDINGFIIESCELIRRTPANVHDLDYGTVNSARFLQYARSHLIPNLGNYHLGEDRSIVVMDNASVHGEELVNLINASGAIIIFQSAYSPDLNPIEYCFHQFKAHLKRHNFEYGRHPILAYHQALQSVTPLNMRNYYRKIGSIQNVPNDFDFNQAIQLILVNRVLNFI